MLESDLRTYLIEDSTLTGYVGERIYPLTLPQGVELPAITYQRVSCVSSYNLDRPNGVVEVRIQIDTWASKYITMKQIAQRIMELLNGYRGGIGGTPVLGVFLEVGSEQYENESGAYRYIHDFRFVYHEN